MKFGIRYEVIVRDRHGKVVATRRGQNSLLKNCALIFFEHGFRGNTAVVMTDTGGTPQTCGWSYATTPKQAPSTAAATLDTFGIQVGTGTNAVTANDYALQTKIAHGSGAGQLSYGLTTIPQTTGPAVTGSRAYFDFVRIFTNNSGGDITINELGLVAEEQLQVGTKVYIMYARDKLTTGATVPNGGTIQVKYTLYVTV